MMVYVAWQDSLSVNDRSLDAEHQQIIDTINRLYLPMQGRTPGLAAERILGTLAQHARTHFDHEEERMQEIAFREFLPHRAMHDRMMRRMLALKAHLTLMPAPHVLAFLKDWWLQHIQVEDQKYAIGLEAARIWDDRLLCQ